MPSRYKFALDNFSNFRLYALHSKGTTVEQLAALYKMSAPVVAEHIEAARLCLEKQVRIEAHEPQVRNSNLLSAL
jgi:hypothetical protein